MSSPSSNTAPPHAFRRICLRDPTTIRPRRIPENYEFLSSPIAHRKYRVNFRHPGYPSEGNLLFTLYAWDDAEGGIHHGLAHNACAIFADNAFDGYLSRRGDTMEGDRIEADWDDILPAGVVDYWFYVPRPIGILSTDYYIEEAAPLDAHDTEPPTQTPYRWPVVATFQDWKFPRHLPVTWTRCMQGQISISNIAPQSNLTSAIRHRDISCKVTAFESGTEVAHLIPEHERQWFLSNSMSEWNSDLTLDPNSLLRDLGNAVLLRSDIHTAFDQRRFVFFPKSADGFVVHMLEPTSDIGLLYHNTPIQVSHCTLEFIFARFAWSLFPSLSGFLSRPSKGRLVALSLQDTGERVVRDISDTNLLTRKIVASRSNSPTKRSRMAADLGEYEETAFDARKRRRTSEPCYATRSSKSASSCLLGKEDVSELSHSIRQQTSCSSHSELPTSPENEGHILDILRKQALSRARPADYVTTRVTYDPHRPAREELELMGVEIFSSDDGLGVDVDDDDKYDTIDRIERNYTERESSEGAQH